MSDFLEFFTLEGLLKIIFQVDLFENITDTLTINLFSTGSKFGPVLGLIQSLYNIIFPIAVMLLFVYFMISMVDKVSSENFNWEQLWRLFALLLATKFLIEHGFQILETLFGIGLSITNSFSVVRSPTSEFRLSEEEIQQILTSLNENMSWAIKIVRNVLLWIVLLIPALISWLMKTAVAVICYSRVVEVYTRAVFTPAALSDLFHGGLQSGGWRYLKSFFAICLQGATIMVIAIIYSQLMAVLAQNYAADRAFWAFYCTSIAIQASAIMLMFKSLTLTKEILGVA